MYGEDRRENEKQPERDRTLVGAANGSTKYDEYINQSRRIVKPCSCEKRQFAAEWIGKRRISTYQPPGNGGGKGHTHERVRLVAHQSRNRKKLMNHRQSFSLRPTNN